ncbi:ribonuclease inhibitor-like protein [Paenibacillus larvae subsp. larvae DSM 25719]|uniref:barstar family protein n=1 Tax=Paenibacillus larvae TaxID=1464 RepID=UPI0003DD0C8F|nr:barstar family protein [Paenibacillus larvae]ETK30064.1 ribonuclease inhibitor-like protein [Paenibacillus larvae subsp. larvae DSM 25719]
MREIILDGKKIESPEHLHTTLQEALDLPGYYGHNLDALWDSLTGLIEMPLIIRWVHFQESEEKLGEYSRLLLELFRDAEREVDGFQLKIE